MQFYIGLNNISNNYNSIFSDDLDSNGLLTGKLINQGSIRSKVLSEAARSLGVKSNQVEEVKVRFLNTIIKKSFSLKLSDLFINFDFLYVINFQGREVAESARQHIQPKEDLQIGSWIEEYKQMPSNRQVQKDIGSAMYEKVRGKILDENVRTGR